MAIIDDLPGVEVAVTIDKNDLEEYHDNDVQEEERTTTKYIEAREGQSFAVRITVPKTTRFEGDCLAGTTFVDGNWVGELLFEKEICAIDGFTDDITGIEEVNDSVRAVRQFCFRALDLDGDGSAPMKDSPVKQMSSIVVYVNHRNRGAQLYGEVPASFQDEERVTEKDFKSRNVSQRISLGEAVPSTQLAPKFITTHRVPGAPEPAATFVFLYRSEDALKSMRLIEDTPEPMPLEARDPADLTWEELMELNALLRARAGLVKEEPNVPVKREGSNEPPRRPKKSRRSVPAARLELGDEGDYRERSTPTLAEDEREVEVIDLSQLPD